MKKSASDRGDVFADWEKSLRESFKSFRDKYENYFIPINQNFHLTIKEILLAFFNANNLFSEYPKLSFPRLYLLDNFLRFMPKYFSLGMISLNQDMFYIYEKIEKYASAEQAVFIYGETGTGKELVAESLYKFSARKDKPFIPVNCAAIPQSTIESELFGYEKGSHSKADKTKIGYFEAANNGTIFLDEIADLSLDAQAKLLRVLQEKKIIRVGGTAEISADFRLVAATNKNLLALMKDEKFRKDLYYRIKSLTIELKPLWHHWEDIPFLLYYFINRANSSDLSTLTITGGQLYDILTSRWPGNTRQLQNEAEAFPITNEFSQDIQPCEFGPPNSLLVSSKIKPWEKFRDKKYCLADLPTIIDINKFMREAYSFFGIDFDMDRELGSRIDHIYPEQKDMSRILESYLLDPVAVLFELIARHEITLENVEMNYLKAFRKMHPQMPRTLIAEKVGITPKPLREKFKKYEIT